MMDLPDKEKEFITKSFVNFAARRNAYAEALTRINDPAFEKNLIEELKGEIAGMKEDLSNNLFESNIQVRLLGQALDFGDDELPEIPELLVSIERDFKLYAMSHESDCSCGSHD